MPERSKDWINQAIRDLKAAESLIADESYEWSCFISQQAAEKAIKSVFQKRNAEAWGHSLYELSKILSKTEKPDDALIHCVKNLDKYYIPTRDPNGFESGSPFEYFTRSDAEDAVVCVRRIIEFCESLLA
jgi:HEPN domain-containing protein